MPTCSADLTAALPTTPTTFPVAALANATEIELKKNRGDDPLAAVAALEIQPKRSLSRSATPCSNGFKKTRFGAVGCSGSSGVSSLDESETEIIFRSHHSIAGKRPAINPLPLGSLEDPSPLSFPFTSPSFHPQEAPLLTPRSGKLDASASLGAPSADLAEALASSFEETEEEDEYPDGWSEEKLVQVLTNDVEDLCVANESMCHIGSADDVSDELRVFFSQYKQPFAMGFYIQRLVQYANCSTAAFMTALVYLDRVHAKCPSLALTEMNSHRLLSTALVLAVKFLDDEVYSNAYYARVSGLTTAELNGLETEMLRLLDWRLSVDPAVFVRYQLSLLKASAVLECESLPQTPEGS